jgi:hypothetical protein
MLRQAGDPSGVYVLLVASPLSHIVSHKDVTEAAREG